MNINELRDLWEAEEKAYFSGWNFSHLKGRWQEEPLSWDYKTIINDYRKPCHKLLDMGTGGGEFLMSIGHPYENTTATESWEPNYQLCKENLEPLGICIKKVFEDNNLPFEDNTFDLIINRHESYDLAEVRRILKPGGYFITQQVGGKNNSDLSERLIEQFTPEFPDFDLERQISAFQNNQFKIIFSKEEFPTLKFYDVGAIVFYAKIIPWEFPDFSVDKCFDRLLDLNTNFEDKGFIECTEHRFMIVAKKL